MKSRTKSAVANDQREKVKTCGGPQADTGLDSLQSAISSMLLQQFHSIGNEFDDAVVLHSELDNTPCPDKEVGYKDYEINKILHTFF